MEWEEGGGGCNLLMSRSNEGFARVFDEGIVLCEGLRLLVNNISSNYFVGIKSSIFQLRSRNNEVPITKFQLRSRN